MGTRLNDPNTSDKKGYIPPTQNPWESVRSLRDIRKKQALKKTTKKQVGGRSWTGKERETHFRKRLSENRKKGAFTPQDKDPQQNRRIRDIFGG